MCTGLPPLPVAPIWPWQAPGSWLDFAWMLVLVAGVCAVGIAGLRRQPVARQRRTGWALLLVMTLFLSAGYFLLFLVASPLNHALDFWWYQAEHTPGCSSADWQPLFDGALQTIQHTQDTAMWLMLVGFLLYLVLLWRYPLRKRAATVAADQLSSL